VAPTLVTLVSRDGLEHDAVLYRDERAARHRERISKHRLAVVHAHGIMGNFLVGTLRFLPSRLARAGYPVIVTDTRMGNVGQLFGDALWEPALLDLQSTCTWLRAQGYDRLVLSGYSSGATLATLMAATQAPTGLCGLVSLGGPWGLPQAMQARADRFGAEPPYEVLVDKVRQVATLAPDAQRNADRVFVVERSRGPTCQPKDAEVYTARTWWQTRGPEAYGAMACRQIARVEVPVLFVQGGADEVVHPDEATKLARLARDAANADVELVQIDGVGHDFVGGEVAVVDAISAWLARRT
jgi:pimeloyl-ACP methyl ester carboxylesterase